MKNTNKNIITLFLFLLSGWISLIFQVSWLKMLLPVFGNTVWAVGTLLTAFMGGLALGSWLFGKIADRTGSPLKLYGILEGFIGLYGMATIVLFKNLHLIYIPLYGLSGGDNVVMGIIKFFLALILLLPPTICMGGTLPLLAKQFTTDSSKAGSGIGYLYTVNTLGAVIGTFVAGFFMIPMMGLHNTVISAAVFNFIILGVILVVTYKEKVGIKLRGLFAGEKIKSRKEDRWLLIIYLTCGLTGLSYEVIWNRILTLHLGSSVYAYSIMLAVYLVGITLGAGLVSAWMKRIKNPVRWFAAFQLILAFDLILIINQFGNLSEIIGAMGEMMVGQSYFSYIASLTFSTLQLLLLPTLMMGACFPLAVRLYVKNDEELGGDTGKLYAMNTLGTIIGSFGGGFVLLPLLGAQMGLLVTASLNLAAGIYLVTRDSFSKFKKVLVGVICVVVFYGGYLLLTYPNQVILSAGIFKSEDQNKIRLLTFDEDIYATVTVEERTGARGTWRQLSMNGVGVAGTSSELFTIQKLQGHLPLLLHPNPKSVLHIGFGSGGTAWAVSRYPVEKITIAEISRSVIKKASKYFQMVNHGVLNDRRVKVVFTDGRNKVLADTETYDVILSDSIHPRFSGNGSLYTYDYYELLKKRLKPGGLVSQWLPFYSITPENFRMIVKSFYKVFPYTSVWYTNNTLNSYVIVIGKLDNGKIDFARLEQKLKIPGVAADLKEINCDSPFRILDFFFFANEKVNTFTGNVKLHTDDNMAVEYLSGRAISKSITSYLNFILLLHFREPVTDYLVDLDVNGENKGDILKTLDLYYRVTSFNLNGQRLFWEGRREEAFRQFNIIPLLDPEYKSPVEYFGAPFQVPFLRRSSVVSN